MWAGEWSPHKKWNMLLPNGMLINRCWFFPMKDWIYSSMCASSRQVCPEKKYPCEIFTVYSKTSSHKEKTLTGIIHILPPVSCTTWTRSKWVNRDSSAGSWEGIHPQQQFTYPVWAHAPAWEGQPHGQLSCACSGNDTCIHSLTRLASLSQFPC